MIRWPAWLSAAASLAAFVAAFFWRMHAAYGPFNLTGHSSDWAVVWELWRHGQIAPGVVAQSAVLGAAAAAVPWVARGLAGRRRRAR